MRLSSAFELFVPLMAFGITLVIGLLLKFQMVDLEKHVNTKMLAIEELINTQQETLNDIIQHLQVPRY